jgi:hypothetical protein
MHGPGDSGTPLQAVPADAGYSTGFLPIAVGVGGGVVLLAAATIFAAALRGERRLSHPPALHGQSR